MVERVVEQVKVVGLVVAVVVVLLVGCNRMEILLLFLPEAVEVVVGHGIEEEIVDLIEILV
tara:strand:- start:218 stop:400 length:183 start_codon:yes stop_codon:yes gene_type:complete